MYPPLHHGDRNVAGLPDHELSGVTHRGRARESRNIAVRNAHWIGEIIGKRSQARAQHEPDLWTQFRLRKNESSGGFGASKEVGTHLSEFRMKRHHNNVLSSRAKRGMTSPRKFEKSSELLLKLSQRLFELPLHV